MYAAGLLMTAPVSSGHCIRLEAYSLSQIGNKELRAPGIPIQTRPKV